MKTQQEIDCIVAEAFENAMLNGASLNQWTAMEWTMDMQRCHDELENESSTAVFLAVCRFMENIQ